MKNSVSYIFRYLYDILIRLCVQLGDVKPSWIILIMGSSSGLELEEGCGSVSNGKDWSMSTEQGLVAVQNEKERIVKKFGTKDCVM